MLFTKMQCKTSNIHYDNNVNVIQKEKKHMETNYKLRNAERLTRLVLGLGIVLSILVTPLTPMGIFIVFLLSIYPLLTSLIAIDPIFRLISKTNNSEYEKNDYRMRITS